jgi:hypothetical protein
MLHRLTAGSFSDAGDLIFDTPVNPLAVGKIVRILTPDSAVEREFLRLGINSIGP